MAPNVFADQLILRPLEQGACKICDGRAEGDIAQGQVVLIPRPTQIQVQRLVAESMVDALRDGFRPAPVEVAPVAVPRQLAVGQNDEHSAVPAILHPILKLLSHPVRGGGLG